MAIKREEMNKDAEHFRKITMKVLTMQLNSVTLMDLIAYGGSALGVIFSCMELRAGNLNMMQALAIILLAAEFFHSTTAARFIFPHCDEWNGGKR